MHHACTIDLADLRPTTNPNVHHPLQLRVAARISAAKAVSAVLPLAQVCPPSKAEERLSQSEHVSQGFSPLHPCHGVEACELLSARLSSPADSSLPWSSAVSKQWSLRTAVHGSEGGHALLSRKLLLH